MVLKVHRIIEYLKLEGIHENHSQDYLKPNHDLRASSRCSLNSDKLALWPLPPGEPVPEPRHPLGEKPFPCTPSEHPLMQLDCISVRLTAGHQRDQHLPCTAPPLESVDCDEVTLQPPLLQDEQAKLPHLLLISLALQAFHYLHCPPWNTV